MIGKYNAAGGTIQLQKSFFKEKVTHAFKKQSLDTIRLFHAQKQKKIEKIEIRIFLFGR